MFSDLEKHELAEAAASRHESRFRFVARFLKNWVLERLAYSAPVPSWRASLHRWRGVQMGKNVYVGFGVIFDRVYPDQITIGDDAVIGDRCIISAHSCGTLPQKTLFPRVVKPVRIGKGVWVAPASIIIAGVEIGDLSVIGTGSVVTRSIPPKSVAVGVPARVIKTLDLENPSEMAASSGSGA